MKGQKIQCKHCDKVTNSNDDWNIKHSICHGCYFTELEEISKQREDRSNEAPHSDQKTHYEYSSEDILTALRNMNEYDFEFFVADLWEKSGWDARVTSGSRDGGKDIIAEKSEPFPEKQVIQAKRYGENSRVVSDDIQRYASLRLDPNTDSVVVVTSGKLTQDAKEIADERNVKIVDGNGLVKLINSLGARDIVEKYIQIAEEPSPFLIDRGSSTGNQKRMQQAKMDAERQGPGPVEEAIKATSKVVRTITSIGYGFGLSFAFLFVIMSASLAVTLVVDQFFNISANTVFEASIIIGMVLFAIWYFRNAEQEVESNDETIVADSAVENIEGQRDYETKQKTN